MIEPLLALPAHLRERLAAALETGTISPPFADASLRAVLGPSVDLEPVRRALCGMGGAPVAGAWLACWLRGLTRVEERLPRPDLVWSGPEVPGVPARDTRRVFEELMGAAERTLWISTYAFFDGPRAFEVLARRMAAVPSLQVTLLLNIQRQRGDTTAREELVRRFTHRFWSSEWPGDVRPAVFFDPRALELEHPAAVLHAKAVVADDEAVYVTSANLTEAAFDRNIELGLLVRDCALAASVTAYFRALIERELLHPLPRD